MKPLHQGLGPNSFSNVLVLRRQARKSSPMAVALTLTPLIDCFSILVIFLLNQLAVDPSALETPVLGKLPGAVNVSTITTAAPTLQMNSQGIFMGEKKIAELSQASLAAQEVSKLHSEEKAPLILQADRELPGQTITSLLKALNEKGLRQVQLAVIKEGEEKPQ